MSEIQHTLVFLKPDAVKRKIMGRIITIFEEVGMRIVAAKMMKMTEEQAKNHYAVHADKPFFNRLVRSITQEPIFVMVIEGVNAIACVRKMVGDSDPKLADPSTIRGRFSHQSISSASAKDLAVNNVIHAADSDTAALHEIRNIFDGSNELTMLIYKNVDESLTL
jgi:nucleoside-diphosphate kinase